jgi:hypothetical protein
MSKLEEILNRYKTADSFCDRDGTSSPEDEADYSEILRAAKAWQTLQSTGILPEEAHCIVEQYKRGAVGKLGSFRYSSARIIGAYTIAKAIIQATEYTESDTTKEPKT